MRAALFILGVTALFWVVCVIALWIYAGPGGESERREVVIDPGDSELIAAGQNPLDLPSTWTFRTGDVLVLDNRDHVAHTVGTWSVGSGRTLEVKLQASPPPAFCSIHPDGVLNINVEPRRTDLSLTIFPTLALGPAMGVIMLGVRRIHRSLEEEDAPVSV